MTKYRRSTQLWLTLLGIWAVVGFSQPKLIPGVFVATVGIVLSAMVVLSHFRAPRIPIMPIALAALAIASPLWAGTTIGQPRALLFAAVTISAIIFASYVTPKDAIRILDTGFKVVAVTTIVMMIVARGAAFETRWPNEGALIGPYVHKNILGAVLLLGLVTALYARTRTARRFELVSWVAVYGGLTALIQSSAAIVLGITAVLLAVVMNSWSKRTRTHRFVMVTLTFLWLVIIVPLLIANVESLLAIVGRDLTLSGRNRIWQGAILAWNEQPWFGYGWGVPFSPESNASAIISYFTYWIVPQAHNGYLSVALQLGWIGFTLFAAYTLRILFGAFRHATEDATSESLWLFQIAFVFTMHNIFESWLDNTHWFLAVAIGVWLIAIRPKRGNATEPPPLALVEALPQPIERVDAGLTVS
ncbi:O-antigen ligase family protein [Micromonospora sicca]|nr:O-antigen ligase family protein [Micromonospora sp. 4G51]